MDWFAVNSGMGQVVRWGTACWKGPTDQRCAGPPTMTAIRFRQLAIVTSCAAIMGLLGPSSAVAQSSSDLVGGLPLILKDQASPAGRDGGPGVYGPPAARALNDNSSAPQLGQAARPPGGTAAFRLGGPKADANENVAPAIRGRAPAEYAGQVSEPLNARLRLDVGDRVFFSQGSSDLGARARIVLSGQAKWLRDRPQVNAVIAGHADEGPGEHANLSLSERRAEAVRQRLIEEGVRATRLDVSALGRTQPIAMCDTPACAAQNRRAVMVILAGPRDDGGGWSQRRHKPAEKAQRAW